MQTRQVIRISLYRKLHEWLLLINNNDRALSRLVLRNRKQKEYQVKTESLLSMPRARSKATRTPQARLENTRVIVIIGTRIKQKQAC